MEADYGSNGYRTIDINPIWVEKVDKYLHKALYDGVEGHVVMVEFFMSFGQVGQTIIEKMVEIDSKISTNNLDK